jgi:hypothetical protein
MDRLLKPIGGDGPRQNIGLLHKALEALGHPVSEHEADEHEAGPDTRSKIASLLAEANIQPSDDAVLDDVGARALEGMLEARGLTEAERSFTVSGSVRLPDGNPGGNQPLLAFDLDLRGVAVYRDVGTLSDIESHGGFELLGETVSDADGNYILTFYDWQYQRAERKKADVVVYAQDRESDEGSLSGRSRVVASIDYVDTGLVRGLDVLIERTGERTEYEVVMKALGDFLEESGVGLAEIAESRDQVVFTAGELGLAKAKVRLAARAQTFLESRDKRRLHEFLYGLGRQGIALEWPVLLATQATNLRRCIERSVARRITGPFEDKEIVFFLELLRQRAAGHVVGGDEGARPDLKSMLASAFSEPEHRTAFIAALASFEGDDAREFWQKHLPSRSEFKGRPELISGMLLTQQLTMLTANNQALVRELQVNRQIDSLDALVDLSNDDWREVVAAAGVPDLIPGETEEAKAETYASVLQSVVSSAMPTQRVRRMIAEEQLSIEQGDVAKGVMTFLSENDGFDLTTSRVHDFDDAIKEASGKTHGQVRSELLKLQRVMQVSPAPETMAGLLDKDLHSAHSIASIPRNSFVKTYSDALGGESTAYMVHQRASHIATRAEMSAMYLMEYTKGGLPKSVLDFSDFGHLMDVVANELPNYSVLFGSPDLCECEHCRSIYSAAAYFVDLLRFLWRGEPNADGQTPLDVFSARRPDLLHLLLTCENTNTVIPYIDLASEVMEFYVANGSLTGYEGHDTGETTAEELRADVQYLNLEAYRTLKDSKYPFDLPYHQPLDVIRTYSDHLRVGRYDAMKAVNPNPVDAVAMNIAAESLRLSQEEFATVTGVHFDGTPDGVALHSYFGYGSGGNLEDLSAVREFLRRTGMSYVELADLVSTNFVNPFQSRVDFLEKIIGFASLDPGDAYTRLQSIAAGTLTTSADGDISAALTAYNASQTTAVQPAELDQWLIAHFPEFRQVVTLYEPDSKCDLDTTELRTIQSIYEAGATSGITNATWEAINRFVRLWRKLGWTIHETDLVLTALGETAITDITIEKLEAVSQLISSSKQPLNKLATLWGAVDTYGKKSLYRKLFLNKAVQRIDEAFQADSWGDYLQDGTQVLKEHQSAILAAFRIREDDLSAILDVAQVIDGGIARPLDLSTDVLNLGNLSTIYRYVVLAKAAKTRVTELCRLISLFDASPFSLWDVQLGRFTAISPTATQSFYELASATRAAGFKAEVLEYVFQGTLPAESTIGLDEAAARSGAAELRNAFAIIDQAHPDTPPSPLTPDVLVSKLALTFQPDAVARLMSIIDGSATFETTTTANLAVVIPTGLSDKYTYVKGSGRLMAAGVMTDAEQTSLKGLPNATAAFGSAVDELYAAAESFFETNFNGVLDNLAEANKVLLDHPAQAVPVPLEGRLAYVYGKFIPILKSKLRRDAVIERTAALIGLSNESTSVLIAPDIDALVAELPSEGFSAIYFSDPTWTTGVLQRTDGAIDFAWGTLAPDPLVPADSFSVRWEAYISAPASGDYTLIVETGADEAFSLYLDDALILQKAAADPLTSWEVVAPLNAARLHLLRIDYAEGSQDAAINVSWKAATSAPASISGAVAYPKAVMDSFVSLIRSYHRAGKFISGFALSDAEVGHFAEYPADFGGIDFNALTPDHWKRILDYVGLRNAVPQAQAMLTDVFAVANRSTPAPTTQELRDLLRLATAWDETALTFLVDTHFVLTVSDFKNEIALNRVRAVMDIVITTGLAAPTIAVWGASETDFDVLNGTAQLIKNTVQAKYGEEDWLELAGDLSDAVRESQQDALVSYLLTRPEIQAWGAKDADGLFEYFLIDVQMSACMDTSRIVQANSSVQMFVNRCLLNLESDTTSGVEKGVSPGAIDSDRWETMKHYRVFEAARKVFVTPENWVEPEWRMDRSEFFKDLESYLVQNDITDRTVEDAFRNYLSSLNDVANLDVCGIHRENYDDGSLKYIHVFGRTHNAPYKFYYRRWNEFRKWSAWERVQVDVKSVEDPATGALENNGVELVPVVWKKRLFLFWPEFQRVVADSSTNKSQSIASASKDSIASLEAAPAMQIKLAWSEYVDGKWTPKQLTNEYVTYGTSVSDPWQERDFLLTAYVSPTTQQLTISVTTAASNVSKGAFILTDIQSPIKVSYPFMLGLAITSPYEYQFSKRRALSAPLFLFDDTYLRKPVTHTLLPVDTMKGANISLTYPFFFSDVRRTYFVRPVDITIIEWVRQPESVLPFFPDLVDDSGWLIPEIPHYGPDDYMPGDIFDHVTWGQPPEIVVGPGEDMTIPYGHTVMPQLASFAAPSFAASSLGAGPLEENDFAVAVSGQPTLLSDIAIDPQQMATQSSIATMTAMSAMTAWPAQPTYTIDISQTAAAFGGLTASLYGGWISMIGRADTGLEFHTFYHPFSGEYVKRLNQAGLPGLMESDTALLSDGGSTFEGAYDPNFSHGLVQKPADFPTRTYYKENVCFDVYGANSIYNWELFFHAPLYIANRLSKNGRYEEAMKWFHYVFDPTSDALPGPGESATARYWNVLPFKTTPADNLEDWFKSLGPNGDPNVENSIIAEWRANPFDPHLVAANRPLAYMKNVVIRYVENLIDWGDSLFRQDTMESVNEALQLYVMANHILGPRPERVPKRGQSKAESYFTLKDKLDDFSNALIELENIFPYSSTTSISATSTGTNLLGVGSSLYFCIPPNEKLMESWDLVEDRLYKIRHCQNLQGIERHLALFAPPIDPAALIQAASQGLSIGSILGDLSSPPPIYRFNFLLQRANEFCNDVKTLGSVLLSALEKKDAEEIAGVRASHETQMLDLMTGIRERQILDAKANKENLQKGREAAILRLQHYIDLLGNDSVTVPSAPSLSSTLTADSQLPPDTVIATVETDVDDSLADSGESGVKVIAREKEELDLTQAAKIATVVASSADTLGAILALFPQLDIEGTPFGVGAGAWWGGQNLGQAAVGVGRAAQGVATFLTQQAAQAATMASYVRREQEWTFEANVAARDVIQLDKQITSADIQIQVAQKELENHQQQIENAKDVEQFLKDKFTNQELYQWMKEQLFGVYKQSYNLAFEMAKKAEKAYKFEVGNETASFIQYGYWDSSKQGLVAGEKLQLALRQLEKSYLDENVRELELTKSVSLAAVNPLALLTLRETGTCDVSLPEELFDMDFLGHYFRRIKAVRLSVPCVAGPYTSVSCSLRLLNNAVRTNTSMNSMSTYEHENDEGVWIDDDRFRTNLTPVNAIATSTAQSDSGMLEFSFRDDRYLPFERAGVISQWQIELTEEKELRQFDYGTVSDVILHIDFTAREAGGLFKKEATTYLKNFFTNVADLSEQPLTQMFDLKHQYPTEWYAFLHPATQGADQVLAFTLGMERFPFFVRDRTVVVEEIEVFAKATTSSEYKAVVSYIDLNGDPVTSSEVTLPVSDAFGGLNKVSIGVVDAGLNLEELDVTKAITLSLKRTAAADFHSLETEPDELEDAFLVMHYKLG